VCQNLVKQVVINTQVFMGTKQVAAFDFLGTTKKMTHIIEKKMAHTAHRDMVKKSGTDHRVNYQEQVKRTDYIFEHRAEKSSTDNCNPAIEAGCCGYEERGLANMLLPLEDKGAAMSSASSTMRRASIRCVRREGPVRGKGGMHVCARGRKQR
jgi:hypothetical protein